jgi:hypothetical protein
MYTFRQVHWIPLQNKMAYTEVMRSGVRVPVAFLLSEISASLEKGEEKEICLRKELD